MPQHRVNVYFSDQAYRTLEEVAAARGMSMSEVLRESVALARWWTETRAQGGRILVERPNGSVREVVSF